MLNVFNFITIVFCELSRKCFFLPPYVTNLKVTLSVIRIRETIMKWCHISYWLVTWLLSGTYFIRQKLQSNSKKRKGHVFFIVRNCSFFMGIFFCSSVVLAWIFNTRGVCNFIIEKANISVNLVPFFNGVLFLFYRF